jgi:hypothetical protein
MIRLKRISGNFPSDDSIEYLLTDYFESCSIVNLNQEFELDLYDDSKIKFEVDEIIYKNEFPKNINQRIEEINKTIEFNTLIVDEYKFLTVPKGISECESIVTDYQWHYHTLGKKLANLGYLVQTEVEIDFVISEQPPPVPIFAPPIQLPNPSNLAKPFIQTIPSISPTTVTDPTIIESTVFNNGGGRSLVDDIKDHQAEILTPAEMRRRRLEFYDKKDNLI